MVHQILQEVYNQSVSASTTAGFSIVKYTVSAMEQRSTIGHELRWSVGIIYCKIFR